MMQSSSKQTLEGKEISFWDEQLNIINQVNTDVQLLANIQKESNRNQTSTITIENKPNDYYAHANIELSKRPFSAKVKFQEGLPNTFHCHNKEQSVQQFYPSEGLLSLHQRDRLETAQTNGSPKTTGSPMKQSVESSNQGNVKAYMHTRESIAKIYNQVDKDKKNLVEIHKRLTRSRSKSKSKERLLPKSKPFTKAKPPKPQQPQKQTKKQQSSPQRVLTENPFQQMG